MNNKRFKVLLEGWNHFISESEEDPSQEQWFLRFGDPRKLDRNTSMIHDAGVLQDEEEYFYSPEGKRLQQYEKGISAYRLSGTPGEKITFVAPIGIRTFRAQLGGFLLGRMIYGDIYVFKAIPTGTYGTDDEPLVIKDSINSVQKVGDAELYVSEDVGKPEFNLYELLDPWELKSYHDMGAEEFFKRKVNREDVEKYCDKLISHFKDPKQIQAIEKVKNMWLEEIEESGVQ